jgi:hypothetical protein
MVSFACVVLDCVVDSISARYQKESARDIYLLTTHCATLQGPPFAFRLHVQGTLL